MITNDLLTLTTVVKQSEGNIVSVMDGEKVMLSISNGKYYNLGRIGGDIWDLIIEPTSIKHIVEKLIYQYDVSVEICEEHVISFLYALKEENIVELVPVDNM